MSEIDVADLEQTIQVFYSNPNPASETNNWLTVVQLTPQAWSFCWQLINPNKAVEVQFYGACTLHTKISKFWHELPVEQYDNLKSSLLERIISCSAGPKMVVTRLCISLASFVIHTITEAWQSAIPDIISALQQQNFPNIPQARIIEILLEILTVIPEEFETSLMAQSQRGFTRNGLQKSFPHVLSVIAQMLSQSSQETQIQVLRCVNSWVQFGAPLPDCEGLLQRVIHLIMTDDDLCEPASEVVCNFITNPDAHKYPAHMLALMKNLLQLEDLLHRFRLEGNIEKCGSIHSMFVNLGECHCKILLDCLLKDSDREHALKVINIILDCSNTPGSYPIDERASIQTVGFWYILQDEVSTSEPGKCEVYRSYLVPVFVSLVDVLVTKSMYPSDEAYLTWTPDEKEQFRCYRQDLGDTLMYCYNLLRESVLERLYDCLQRAVTQAQAHPHSWQPLEAALIAFHSVAEIVDIEENYHLPRFIALLPSIPYNDNVPVISAALDALGGYAEWINVHPEVLGHIIPLLIVGLSNVNVAPAATRALKDISRDCQLSLAPFTMDILRASQAALGNLPSREKIRLMATIGRALSLLPFDTIMDYLNTVLAPCLQVLERLLHLGQPTIAAHEEIVTVLSMLSVLFANLDVRLNNCEDGEIEGREDVTAPPRPVVTGPQPVLIVLQKILPLLLRISPAWGVNPQVVECLTGVMKRALSTLMDDIQPVASDVLTLCLNLFTLHPHTLLIDLVKQFLLMFVKDDSLQPLLRDVFNRISTNVLTRCHHDLRGNTDVAEEYLQMLGQLVKKEPPFIAKEGVDVSQLFLFGVAAIALPETPTVKAGTHFLVHFIGQSREVPALTAVVNNQGELLVGQILKAIGGESPRTVMDQMAEILVILSKKYFDNLCRWFNTFISQDGFPNSLVSREQKEKYIRLLLKERVNKRRVQEIVKEFTLVCRGLIGTEYGHQSLGLP